MARTERLFRLHNLLKDRKRLRFDELMERTGVSPATLKRDLKYLRERLGSPLKYDPLDRCYSLEMQGPRARHELPGLWFGEAELYALLLAHKLLAEIDPNARVSGRLRALVQRIEGLFTQRGSDSQLLQRIRLINPGRRDVDGTIFSLVSQATVQRRRLRMRYYTRSRQASSVREVSPQRLVYHRTWYLDGVCHKAKSLRRFALDGIESLEVMDAGCEEVPLHQIETAFDGSYGTFPGEARRWGTLVFSPEVSPWVGREQWHPMQQVRTLPDGSVEMKVPYTEPTELVMDILRHAEHVKVTGDAPLRTAVKARVTAMARHYSAGS